MDKFKKVYLSCLLSPVLLATLFFILYAAFSLHRHLTFNSSALDLGIYVQASYLYSHWLVPFSTLLQMIVLGDHFGPIILLLSPIYAVFPSAVTLLVLQALFVSFSSIPIYLIAKDQTKNELLSLMISFAYLSSVGLINAIKFDFHLATISVLPLSLILYAWHFTKWNFYWLAIFLSLLFKEDIPLFIFGLGIFELMERQTRTGLATIFVAGASFFLIKFGIMPWLWPGTESYDIGTSILPLTDPSTMVLLAITRPHIFLDQMFNSPVKINTFDTLYRQFAFLSLLSPLSWLTVFPALYLRFSSALSHFWILQFHYNANLTPFLTVSAILAINRFKLPQKAVLLLMMFFLIARGLSLDFINFTVRLNFKEGGNFKYISEAIALIPPEKAVSAQSPLVPHLANRQKIYLFPEVDDAEYIVLNTSLHTYPLKFTELQDKIHKLKQSSEWTLVNQEREMLIFKKSF